MGNATEMRGTLINCAASPLRYVGRLALLRQLPAKPQSSLQALLLTLTSTRKIMLVIMVCLPAMPMQAADSASSDLEQLQLQIEQIEQNFGPFSNQLFEPLMALAKQQLAVSDTVNASETLLRAQNIAHRNEGVYSSRQLEILNTQKQLALADGDFETANKLRKFAFFVTTRESDSSDPAVISAYSELAQWYMQSGQTRDARRLLTEAIELARGFNIDPLPLAVQYNRARRLEGLCCRAKELEELTSESAGLNPGNENLASAYLELGYSMTLARKQDRAIEFYAKAHQLLPEGLTNEPVPIPSRGILNKHRNPYGKEYYRVNRHPLALGNQRELEKMTEQEFFEDPARPPGWFLHDPNQEHIGYVDHMVRSTAPSGSAQMSMSRSREMVQAMVGSPILYSADQLQQLLSSRAYRKLQDYRIVLSFTVEDNGDLDDIQIVESTAPNKLNRLLTETLARIYYRPALENGVPVTRYNVRLVQSFLPNQRGSN